MAEKSEIARRVFLLSHPGQAIGSSAFDIDRKQSKLI